MVRKNPYQAYRQATHTVSKTRQVVMLYEGILRNLQQAREAITQKDIETRYKKLVKASEIVLGLQMSLDFNQGEEAAQALYDFYAAVDKRIMKLQRTQDLSECDEIIAEIRSMHEVWQKIDRGELQEGDEVASSALADLEQGLELLEGVEPLEGASSNSSDEKGNGVTVSV